MMNIGETKSELRKKYLNERKIISLASRIDKNKKINKKIKQLEEFKKPALVAAYISDGYEVDIIDVINQIIHEVGKIYLPKFKEAGDFLKYDLVEVNSLSNQLTEGKYGIQEPIDGLPILDEKKYGELIWLIPGVAFDANGGRLGRGKGVYDRMLAKGKGIKIGVFYNCQQCTSVPMDSHDSFLDIVVNEVGTLRCMK